MLAAARRDQLLYPGKVLFADKRFMRVLHSEPFLFRLADFFLILVRDIGLLIVDAVADISLILQDGFDLCNRPGVGLFFRRTGIDIGEVPIPL